MSTHWWLILVVGSCVPTHEYWYKRTTGLEQRLPAVKARVVAPEDVRNAGLHGRPLVIPFENPRYGAGLVIRYLMQADAAGAKYVSDIAVYVQTENDQGRVECRTRITPETITTSQFHPATDEERLVFTPVTQTQTQYETRCKPVWKYESRYVTRWSTGLQFGCQLGCYQLEYVPATECGLELVTKPVTTYEPKLVNEHVPAYYETVSRQRLRELEPVCYRLDAPSATRGNRIEGQLYGGE